MMTCQFSLTPTAPVLHVFEQAGGRHWAITVPRVAGCGLRLIAFSERTFPVEDAAHTEGSQPLASLEDNDAHKLTREIRG